MTTFQNPSFADAASSSHSNHLREYHVFLSFGDDTGRSFSDHLYHCLKRKGIRTFRGSENFEKGQAIIPDRLEAIEKSRSAIVVFSRGYPSSQEHLNELVKIMDTKLEGAFPVFYDVDPSEVRKQTGTFADVFAREDFKGDTKKVNKWRQVLTKIANLSGWDVKTCRYESEVIEDIATKISNILNDTSSGNDSDLVGIDSRIQNLLPLLSAGESDDVRVVGIWGMPGIGKTKLAEEVFERIRDQFDASCFIENVREQSEKHKSLLPLQKQVYETLLGESPKMQTVSQGTKQLGDRLRYMKVLIILDDVDRVDRVSGVDGPEQIKSLTGDLKLASGSRIIVTTRNKHVLEQFGENNVFRVVQLTRDEALQLLSKRAFHKNYPPNDYIEVCSQIVTYANGFPLALKVLGSLLGGKSVDQCSSICERLKEYPDAGRILYKLKLSFDELEDAEKELFLDIACFFKGEPEDRVRKLLEDSNRHPRCSIEFLVDKALITLRGEDRRLWMHDLLQELGWEIVRGKSFQEPCERSRLWLPEDIIDLLKENKGTQAIEGLFLTMPDRKEINLNDDPFPNMKNLKLLKIHNADLSKSPECLSNELRLLEWHDYPSTSLPSSFQPKRLVELTMPSSNIEKLWEESDEVIFQKLLWVNLSFCKNLTQTPTFRMSPNLETLLLKGCTSLTEVHPSVEFLEKLVLLNLGGCENLSSLPRGICRLTSLKTLILEGCKNLSSVPDDICALTSLQFLNVSGCSHLEHLPENIGELEQLKMLEASRAGIRKVPSSIILLKKLVVLSFSGCKGVSFDTKDFPEPVGLQLPDSFAGLDSLESLNLSGCNLPEGAIPQDIGCLTSLRQLDLSENNFTSLPNSMSQLNELRILLLNRCVKLQWLPNLPCIQKIEARDCSALRKNPNKRIAGTSGAGFCLVDCSNSNQEENDMKWHLTPVPLEHYCQLLRKLVEDAIHQRKEAEYCDFNADGIPDWCDHGKSGSSITVDDPNVGTDSMWMGFALYFIYSSPEQVEKRFFRKDLIESTGLPDFHKDVTDLTCHFETDEGPLKKSLVDHINFYGGGRKGLLKYIPREWFSGELKFATRVKVSVTVSDPKVEIEKCGAHVITEQNVALFIKMLFNHKGRGQEYAFENFKEISDHVTKSNISIKEMEAAIAECIMIGEKELMKSRRQSSSRDPPHETFRQESTPSNLIFVLIEEADSTSSDTCQQKRDELQALVSSLLEVNRARNYVFACIFPVKAILPRFTYQCVGNQVSCCLPQGLYDDNTWVGFALYVVLTWHRPSASPDDHGSKVQRPMLTVDMEILSVEILKAKFHLKEDDLFGLRSLVLFHIPRVAFPDLLNPVGSISSSFRTDIPHEVEIEICGIRLVYEQDLEEIFQTVSECAIQSPEVYHQRYCQNFVELLNEESSNDEHVMMEGLDLCYARCLGSNSKFSNGQVPEQNSNSQRDYPELLLRKYYQSFDRTSTYDACFPASDIPEWFKTDHSNDGHSVRIQLENNSNDDQSNWMGLALWASFSTIQEPATLFDNPDSSTPHHLICKLESNSGVLQPLHVYQTKNEEFKWLHIVGGFLWLCYIPRQSCFDMLGQCEFLEASFGSDRPNLSADKCALRLVFEKDNDAFGNIILHCMHIFTDNWDLLPDNWVSETKAPTQNLVPSAIILSIMTETSLDKIDPTTQWQRNLKNLLRHFFKFTLLVVLTITGHFISTFRSFDPDFSYNFGFPHKKVLEWFECRSHSSDVTLQLPRKGLYNDSSWTGLVVCASFEVHENLTFMLQNFGAGIHARLLCHLQMQDQRLGLAPVFDISKEKFKWRYLRGFIWITYIPRLHFPDVLNEVTSVTASFHGPDCPSLMVKESGIRLLYKHEVEEFKETIIQYMTSFFDDLTPICEYISDENERLYHPSSAAQHKRSRELPSNDGQAFLFGGSSDNPWHSKGVKHNDKAEPIELKDFDRDFICSSCFPPNEILEWFIHNDNGSSITIQHLPVGLGNDNKWIGLALCAYFSNIDNSESTNFVDHMDTDTPHHLICQLQTDRGSLEQFLIHQTNNEENEWLNPDGQFFWLSFIPQKWFGDQLNQCSSLDASFVSSKGSLYVEKCGVRLVYQHEEDEFKETIRHCMSLLENKTNKDNVGDAGAGASGSSTKGDSEDQQDGQHGLNDLKGKGKQVVE